MEQKKQVMILSILMVLAAGVWFFVIRAPSPKKAKPEISIKTVGREAALEDLESLGEEISESLAVQRERERAARAGRYRIGEGRDLLAPLNLSLTGIAWDKSRPMAVINGVVVGVGDTVGEAKVRRIDFDSVTVLYKSREFIIRIGE